MTHSKLRVAILGLNYAPEPTGIAPYTTKLAEALAAAGNDVHVITGYPHYPEWKLMDGFSGWQQQTVINGVTVTRLRHYIPRKNSNARRLYLEISFGLRLLIARWNRPDVVIMITPALFSTAFVALRTRFGLRRPPSGIWVQDVYSRGLEELNAGSRKMSRLMRLVEGLTLRSATEVTVIHERFKEYLASRLSVPGDRIRVIRNWTHISSVSTFDREATRRNFGWQEGDVVVLHAGNIGVKQGLDNVVEAARLASQRRSTVRFVLLGDGNQRRHIQEQAHGISHIQFLDPLPDDEFNAALRAADILLVNEMAGLKEMSVPSKLTSYFSTGLPVIAATESSSTTATEIEQSQGGIRTEPNDPEVLLETAEKLASDRPTAEKLGAAGIRYSESNLDQDTAIVQFSEWLHVLAKSKSRGINDARNR